MVTVNLPRAVGTPGADGAPGVGVPVGGTDGQVLTKTSSTDYAAAWETRPSVDATSGWGSYSDTVYTSGSPLALVANTVTNLPNNAGVTLEAQKPADVTTFYNGTVITGRNGDAQLVTIDFVAVPVNPGSTLLEIWFDIGGAVGQLYRRPITFPKGQGIAVPVSFTVSVYTLDTWQANGATVKILGNGVFNLYNIRYVIVRTHKAR